MKGTFKSLGFIITLAFIFTSPAFAHTDDPFSSFMGGFMHPIAGLDHVTAMVAVGILGAFLGKPAIWILPTIFPIMIVVGGILGITGVSIPNIEMGIAASSLILGLIILFVLKMPLWVASLFVAAFAIFHGHAHGTELPHASNPMTYSLGFVLSTTILHITGIAIGELIRWPKGLIFARATGAAIAIAGAWFLTVAL